MPSKSLLSQIHFGPWQLLTWMDGYYICCQIRIQWLG